MLPRMGINYQSRSGTGFLALLPNELVPFLLKIARSYQSCCFKIWPANSSSGAEMRVAPLLPRSSRESVA